MSEESEIAAFHEAAESRNLPYISQAIQNGINVNARDKWGNTVLAYAIWGGDTEIVRMLLDAGAKVALSDYTRKLLFDLALTKGKNEIMKLLDYWGKENE